MFLSEREDEVIRYKVSPGNGHWSSEAGIDSVEDEGKIPLERAGPLVASDLTRD